MQTRDKTEEKRDLELENIVGNLLIAEYQVDRLRTRLADLVDGYRPQLKNNKASTHVFKHNNKWYKLSLKIDETDVSSGKDTLSKNRVFLILEFSTIGDPSLCKCIRQFAIFHYKLLDTLHKVSASQHPSNR